MPAHLYSFTVRLREQKKSFIFHLVCAMHQPCCPGASLGGISGRFSAVLRTHWWWICLQLLSWAEEEAFAMHFMGMVSPLG